MYSKQFPDNQVVLITNYHPEDIHIISKKRHNQSEKSHILPGTAGDTACYLEEQTHFRFHHSLLCGLYNPSLWIL